ncbi:TspO/MBR family protein [Thalassobius sp. MITS945101]|uniref:TspO/MBR family protein n=1 Tax=Thalassobius sp. MITS945101 TaxID=3096994 RepID=UPI00399BCC8D
MTKWTFRIAFLILVMGGGILIGTLTAPGAWYAALNKPVFNPPNWIFAPVWTTLYVLIAMAGWRQFEARDHGSLLTLWWAQLVLNFLWSPAFFVLEMPWLALVVIGALWTTIVLFIHGTWRWDRSSGVAFIPYLAWVSFATVLSLSIAVLN